MEGNGPGMSVQTCDHGRRYDGGVWWRGIPSCEDCEGQEWQRVKATVVIGVSLMTIAILLPAILILCGTFW